MPDEWIDKDTHHRIIKLTRNDRNNLSFYFHNNPFVGDEMVFYSSTKEETKKTKNSNPKDRQLFLINLTTLQTTRLTNHAASMKGEIVSLKRKEVFFQVEDSIFSVNTITKKETLVFIFPSNFKGEITTVNADGSLLAGVKTCEEEKEIFVGFPTGGFTPGYNPRALSGRTATTEKKQRPPAVLGASKEEEHGRTSRPWHNHSLP